MIKTTIDPRELTKPVSMVQVYDLLRADGIPVDSDGSVSEGKLVRDDRAEVGMIVYTYVEAIG